MNQTRPPDVALADWANDDLLISAGAREALRAQHPKMVEVLDWSALRKAFSDQEGGANNEKRRVRAAGRRAVWLAFGAFFFSAIGSLSGGRNPGEWARWFFPAIAVLAAACAMISLFIGLFQTLSGRDKDQWLIRRMWTETLRRFYFQFLLRNLPLALDVMAGRIPPVAWRAAQDRALSILHNEDMERPQDVLQEVLDDTAEECMWVLGSWRASDPDFRLAVSPELEEFLQVMELKRIRAQVDYSSRKLVGSKLALQEKARWLRFLFYILVFLILLLSVVLGIVRALQLEIVPQFVGVVLGSASAVLIALQMWDRGEDISGEAERMEWYHAGANSVRRRYAVATTPFEKLEALTDLEAIAYQEMRQFLISVKRREFVAG